MTKRTSLSLFQLTEQVNKHLPVSLIIATVSRGTCERRNASVCEADLGTENRDHLQKATDEKKGR